jgi:hypothetical protein
METKYTGQKLNDSLLFALTIMALDLRDTSHRLPTRLIKVGAKAYDPGDVGKYYMRQNPLPSKQGEEVQWEALPLDAEFIFPPSHLKTPHIRNITDALDAEGYDYAMASTKQVDSKRYWTFTILRKNSSGVLAAASTYNEELKYNGAAIFAYGKMQAQRLYGGN